MTDVQGDIFPSYPMGAITVIANTNVVNVFILTFTTRPLNRIGGVLGVLGAHLAGDLHANPGDRLLHPQLPDLPNLPVLPNEPLQFPLRPLAQLQGEAGARHHFVDPIVPLARINEDVQAAHNRYQQRLQGGNRAYADRRRAEDRALDDQIRRLDKDMAVRRRRLREIEERYNELGRLVEEAHEQDNVRRGRVGQRPGPANPLNQYIRDAPQANMQQADVGAVGGGLAFGGLDANRALNPFAVDGDRAAEIREMNRFFQEQLRNVPQQ